MGGGTYCPPPLSRQRERQPTAEEPGSHRKTRRSRRPPSERWGKEVATLDPTLNQTKAGALRGPTCSASRWGWSGAWGGSRGETEGATYWWQIVWWGSIPTLGLREGELGVGGMVEEGEMRLGGKGGGAVGVGGGYFGADGVAVGCDLECEEVECEGDEQEEAEKCGEEGEAGGMGDGVAN